MRNIRIFNLTFDSDFRKEFHLGVEQILDEGYLSNHTFCRKFEEQFALHIGAEDSILTSSGTSALEIAFRALRLEEDRVLIPVNTFIATSIACENARAIPVFADIDPTTMTLNLDIIMSYVERDPSVKAVVLVHIGGHITPEIQEIAKYCREKEIFLVEDCAHAHASSHNRKCAGTFGDFGCFSHHMTKVMTMGEGGSIVTGSEELLKRAKSIRAFGHNLNNPIEHVQSGSNFKASEFQGLMGVIELGRLEGRVKKRRKIALRYQRNLSGSLWKPVKDFVGGQSSYYKQIVLSPIPVNEVRKLFKKNRVALTGSVYEIPLHQQPIYKKQFSSQGFPIAEHFSQMHFCPPCYPELELEDVDRICEVLLEC